MRRAVWSVVAIVAALSSVGCGGSSEDGEAERASASSRGSSGAEEPREEPNDGLQIEGLLGAISREQVTMTLEPRADGFARCFSEAGDLDFVGGDIRLAFRIHTDGSVRWVYPSQSSIGHRAVERCIVERARAVRFPRPRGGEAEFSWGFGVGAPADVRPPTAWTSSQIAATLSASAAPLVASCGGLRGYHVTAYVGSGGQVLAVGVAASDEATSAQIDCVAAGVSSWRMPDPGSYPAKVTFDL